MKVSASQKSEIRKKLLETATRLFAENGFAAVTMRDISTGAGYAPSTIYSYFQNREKIFYAWFEDRQQEMFDTVASIAEFNTFTLKEKLQSVLEVQLDIWQKDKSFVGTTYRALLDSPLNSFTELRPVQSLFSREIAGYIHAAVVAGEIPEQPFERFMCHLFWDYRNLVALYWLRDTSNGAMNTSRLIDMSLDIIIDLLQTNVVSKMADIGVFLFRSHFFGNIEKLVSIASLLGRLDSGAPAGEVPG